MSRPLASVVVPVRNGERYLAECLESIFAQDYRPIEVIVVDDGSKDRTQQIAQAFPVRYIYQEHQGVSAARNTGIAAVGGEFVTFFDHDDVMLPTKLSLQIGILLEHPEIAFVVAREKVLCEPGVELPRLAKPDPVTGQVGGSPEMSAVVRRAALDAVGGFDTSYQIAEDTEWTSRLLTRGFKRHSCPEVVMIRRFHGSNLSYQNPGDMTMMFKVLRARAAERRSTT